VTTFSDVDRYLDKLLVGGIIGSVLAVALPLFLFLGFWKVSGLQRAMVLHNLDEYVGSIGERVETAVEEWKRTGTPPPIKIFKKQLSELAKYSPEHPSVVCVAKAIQQAELEVPRGQETP